MNGNWSAMNDDVAKELSRIADALADLAEDLRWLRALFTEEMMHQEIEQELAPVEAA